MHDVRVRGHWSCTLLPDSASDYDSDSNSLEGRPLPATRDAPKNPPSSLTHACVGVIARAIKGLPNHSDYQCSYKGKIQILSLSLKDMLWFLLQQGSSSKLFFANVANDSTKDLQSVSNFIELDEFISTTKWYSPVRFVNFYSHKILHKAGYEKL